MKFCCLVLALVINFTLFAQKIESYYDWQWKPCESLKARFYSTVEKTDSGWLRYDYFLGTMKMQMKALFEDSDCKIYNGSSLFFHSNGQLSQAGRQLHNKREGICLSFYSNGMMSDSASFHNDIPEGIQLRWWPNGALKDSTAHVNDSMDVFVAWFDNGSPADAGYLLHGKPQGKWQYFYKNGGIAALETYDNGALLTRQFFTEDGKPQADTSRAKKHAVFKTGDNAWPKWLANKLVWPYGYTFSNGDMAVTVVDMVVDEDGKVESAEVVTPFHPVFDKQAVSVIRSSPQWTPAYLHNRPVKSYFRQAVTFREE